MATVIKAKRPRDRVKVLWSMLPNCRPIELTRAAMAGEANGLAAGTAENLVRRAGIYFKLALKSVR